MIPWFEFTSRVSQQSNKDTHPKWHNQEPLVEKGLISQAVL